MGYIQNPILRGFNPDPSILRVGEDYYVATSTFEWWPGVRVHHSRDLVHWRLLTSALAEPRLLDLTGNPDSGGVWAPDLSFHNGTFYLVYTDVKSWGLHAPFKDTHNYVVTAPAITGPWSEPVYLNASGFDPSLFHDEDGRHWLLNMVWDHRKGRNPFAGIVLQEYDLARRALVGPVRHIFEGTAIGVTEGPHLYRRDGWYYLMTAEGGTGYEHAVTVARSRRIEGPYEVDPENPVLTSQGRPELELHKAGHASLVEAGRGEWYIAHLCGRPLDPPRAEVRNCPLGREAALQRVEWTPDGWLRLTGGGNSPQVSVPAPDLPPHPWPPEPERDDFDGPELGPHWSTLRSPLEPSWFSLAERPGWLRLRGRESLSSRHRQSLVARRLAAFSAEVTACLEFRPTTFQQMAGLVLIYDTENWIYLRVSKDEALGLCLAVLECDNNLYGEPLESEVPLEGWERVHLRARIEWGTVCFSCSRDGQEWQPVGPVLDVSRLSDEHCHGLGFTGTFVGVCVQDLGGTGLHADFDLLEYREL